MTVKLNDEMREALDSDPRQPLLVEDAQSQRQYVLIPLEDFERLKTIFGHDFDPSETYAAQDEALAEIWDDPELDIYDNYDAHKRSS